MKRKRSNKQKWSARAPKEASSARACTAACCRHQKDISSSWETSHHHGSHLDNKDHKSIILGETLSKIKDHLRFAQSLRLTWKVGAFETIWLQESMCNEFLHSAIQIIITLTSNSTGVAKRKTPTEWTSVLLTISWRAVVARQQAACQVYTEKIWKHSLIRPSHWKYHLPTTSFPPRNNKS